jgi:hypothetical protein
MAVPTLLSLSTNTGPSSGGDLLTLLGIGFAPEIRVQIGDSTASTVSVRQEQGQSVAVVRTPAHAEALVDLVLENLSVVGLPVPGERVVLSSAYRFVRPRIVQESNLTRLIRVLLRELKRQVMENVSMSVAVDFDDTALDGLDLVAISKLPSLVLSGPRLQQNRFLSTNEAHEEIVSGLNGPQIQRRRPPLTVDLEFGITGASDRAVELLNLIGAVSTFLNTNHWIEMLRDPDDLGKGKVRWELDPHGELQVNLEGKDDVRAFTWGLVIRGFDIDEGLPLDLNRAVGDQGTNVTIGRV